MDPSTYQQSPPTYTDVPLPTIQQNRIPSQKSRTLIRYGIAVIVTSSLCLIPLIVLLSLSSSNVWFIINFLFLVFAVCCVYAGYNIEEQRCIIVVAMIMGILEAIMTVPVIIIFCVAICDPSAGWVLVVTVIICSVLSAMNITLAIAMVIITCECCSSSLFHLVDRQTSNMT